MARFTYTSSSGITLDFLGGGLAIQNVSGLGTPPLSVESIVSPLQPGERYRSNRVMRRVIAGDVVLSRTSERTLAELRRIAQAALNPNLDLGVLTVQIGDGDTYRIDALVERWDPPWQFPDLSRGAVQFRCPDPYWRSEFQQESTVIVGLGGVAIPTSIPTEISATDGVTVVTNEGDVESRPVTVIRGAVVSPVLTNETAGETLAFSGLEMEAGDRLEIDHLEGTAELNGASVATELTSGSSYWPLGPGENVIRLEATSGAPQATIRHYHRYSGI